MSKESFALPTARTWRDISQQVKPRAMSREGRRRVTMAAVRAAAGVAAFAAAGWGVWEIAMTLRETPAGAGRAAATPLRPPELVTDGVLDNAWLAKTLALPKGSTLMGLDLAQLRARLMADGQVNSAELVRMFPATLKVRISERSPVVRMMAQFGGDEPRPMLVARDGVSFVGHGFDPAMVASLPWIDGARLMRRGGGLAPVQGMAAVSDLLATAKLETPRLYRTWRIVSLARVASDDEIDVRTQAGLTVTFSTKEDFLRQIARLDVVIESAAADPEHPLKAVNLALGAQVPVSFGTPPPGPSSAPASAAPPARPDFVLPAFPDLHSHP